MLLFHSSFGRKKIYMQFLIWAIAGLGAHNYYTERKLFSYRTVRSGAVRPC